MSFRKQSGISSILIILIILGVLAVAGGVYVWTKMPIKYWFKNPTNFEECKEATRGNIIKTKPPQCEFRGKNFTETKDETTDWKTYRNEKYGFEVKYPKNLAIGIDIPPKPVGTIARVRLQESISNTNIAILVINNPKKLSAREWLIQEGAEPPLIDTQFNGYTAVKSGKSDSSSYFIYIGKLAYIYMIDVIKNQQNDINDQILSTFKFTPLESSTP